MKENGEDEVKAGLTEPLPSVDMVTRVALPSNVPLMFTDDKPQILPLVLFKVIEGHCPDIETKGNKKKLTKNDTLVIFSWNNISNRTFQLCIGSFLVRKIFSFACSFSGSMRKPEYSRNRNENACISAFVITGF